MKTSIFLLLSGCALQVGNEPMQKCEDVFKEKIVGVPYSFDVADVETNTKMVDGCTLTTLTHYVLEDPSEDSSDHKGGLPVAYYERGCGFDGCDGPLNIINPNDLVFSTLNIRNIYTNNHGQ